MKTHNFENALRDVVDKYNRNRAGGIEYDSFDAIRAALQLAINPKDGVPRGWKIVPIEPTAEMIEAGKADSHWSDYTYKAIYSGMLSASPNPPAHEER